ncbi:NACHT domain-containing protein [Paraflavitalea soli]|uniref:NACHT domain-containing protein n=1 Tax=Paraflavitalea soli TaxID=2315862 RepID=A0A3B7MQ93_9BACT|nr:NACHT domain-containing protein [Paraflavitalea soli]AXY75503.1 NACHT domain-containing protein [Paraflavitalea soli]
MDTKFEVTNLITPVINSFRTLSNEWKHFFDIGITEYLQSQTEKYYFTNTFIHRSEKVKFKDIYYPIKATYKNLTTDFEELIDLFDEYKNITLVGSAGSGKTTLMKYIFLNILKKGIRIPILIELRNLNEYNGDFEKLIAEKIIKSKIKPSDDTFKRTLESGKFLFLLDGYDEIFTDKKQEINRQIELFVDSYSKNRFLITTRPGSGIENFPRFYDFKVRELNDNDINGFIEKIVTAQERKERIVKLINDPKNNNYTEYLRNPLLLSMFILAFESHPEIPNRKSSFYRNVYDTLYSRHDGITKNSFPREKITKLQRDDFEKILSIFCYISLLEGKYTFTTEYLSDTLSKVKATTDKDFKVDDLIYDLRTSISILILDGFEYQFPHRSMQEYFTALFISRLPSDKRGIAYKNLSNTLRESSTDNSFNFWSLCKELDETTFTSKFLIPQLKKFQKQLTQKDDKKLLDVFFKIIDPSLLPIELSDLKTEVKRIGIYRTSNFYNSIIDFFNIYDHKNLFLFPERSGAQNELLEIYKKVRAKSPHSKMSHLEIDEETLPILIKFNIVDVIKSFKKSIDNKIIELQNEIQREKENIDEILGI